MITRTLKFVFAGAVAALLLAVSPSIGQAQNVPQPTVHMAQNHFVDFNSIPANMTIARGDTITVTVKFDRDIGLFDPAYLPQAMTTDGKTGDVFTESLALKRIDPDTIQVATFTAQRSGTALVEFRATFKPAVVHARIDVTVQ